MAKAPVPLTQARLKELLHYDPETGLFTWAISRGPAIPAGRIAGTVNKKGYRRIQIDGRLFGGNRLAWLYMTGEIPPQGVDHRDGNRSNDRWSNLRLATHAQNMANKRRYKTNLLGMKGVRLHRNGQYEARIREGGRLRYLGCYRTPEEAKAAYVAAGRVLFGSFARFD